MITQARYVIAVADLSRTTSYYRDSLGFQVQWLDVPGWRLFVRDSCIIMAGECVDAPLVAEIGDHSYFAYLQVSEIEALYTDLVNHGVTIIKTLRSEVWGMHEFGIRTVDGHHIMFGEPGTAMQVITD